MGTASHTERQTELGSRDPRWGLQVALQGWRIGTPGRKSFIERGGWRFSLGQARRMGHWASSLATAVFALPLLSSPLPDVLIAFSLLCFFVSWLIFPLPSLHGARLHFLCPGIFISFWRFSYPFSFFFFFSHHLDFLFPLGLRLSFSAPLRVGSFLPRSHHLGTTTSCPFCTRKPPLPFSLRLKTFTSGLWSFLDLAVPLLSCLGWETLLVSSL